MPASSPWSDLVLVAPPSSLDLDGPGAGLETSLRVLAEDVLGAGSKIDLVAADASHRVVLVVLADEGEDAAALTRCLAQRAWVAPRIADWLKLAPGLDVHPELAPRALLVAPTFAEETRSAAAALGPDVVELARVRALRDGGDTRLLVELLTSASAGGSAQRAAAREPEPSPPAPEPAQRPPSGPLRSGLDAAEMSLSPDECGEFDPER